MRLFQVFTSDEKKKGNMINVMDSNMINATALRKMDSEFKKLLLDGTSAQVAVYRFNVATKSWNKTDIVGCLYLYERLAYPQYGVAVMRPRGSRGRKNGKNFLQKFGSDAQFVMIQPYIIIRPVDDLRTDRYDGSGDMHCIWFYSPKDCVAAANILHDDMKLKFGGEGEDFEGVGETVRCHLDENFPSDMCQDAGIVLFQVLRRGKGLPDEKLVPN